MSRRFPDNVSERIAQIKSQMSSFNQVIGALKNEFREELNSHSGMRTFNSAYIKGSNVISLFSSSLTRAIEMGENCINDDLIVVRIYFYEILKDLTKYGFSLNGEKYIFFTASAGQIRTKKVVFIKERSLQKCQDKILCGLTIDEINTKGGANVNKYLAYLALCNSATDEWPRFNIRKSIVVDDMETPVHGLVDYLDDKTFEITRQEMDVPITHTDGCGMVLPRVSKKNFMIRMPWVKGLLASFPFDEFIREANAADPSVNHALITDIYGKVHDVLAEDIEVIFTKSQCKMWKYYDGWDAYASKFIKNHCTAGICNVEEDYIPRAKTNYQVLQTLCDMSDDEIQRLAAKTVDNIVNIASSRESKLKAFGASRDNQNRNDFQECLLLYPELLQTNYMKKTLREIKDSMVREGRAGKLNIDGKYLFIIPDLYAFCQWLFMGDKNPAGLLKNGEVYCAPYKRYSRLDCLRSPHLGPEHAVRMNVVDAEKSKWFKTAGVYTSCHDLISKILMFDVDGDKSLVCADPLMVEIAARNMRDVVPMHYIMGKAGAVQLDNQAFYDGMIRAYTGGRIGEISNLITKIWNSGKPDLYAIQVLVALTNFNID